VCPKPREDGPPRTTSGDDNHGANEKVSRDWGKLPGTLRAIDAGCRLIVKTQWLFDPP